MERVDTVVIGAGMVGLACARALALAGREVIVLESESAIGTGTSSRNSEVIHAGIYYPRSSLMARLCVAGRQALYPFLAQHGGNGVTDLKMLSGAEARAMESQLACVAALESPSTGIIDSHGFMLALRGDAEDRGAALAFRSSVLRGSVKPDGIELEIGGIESTRLLARRVVNSAGLFAQKLARGVEGFPPDQLSPAYYCKGNYFSLSGRSPFSRLIYPAPETAGLGVHLTLDLAGQARFGPDVEWIERIDYDVDPGRAGSFYGAIRRYWPELKDGALQPAYSGIRPKLS